LVISFVHPTSVATTIHFANIASITVVGKPSCKLGFTKISKDGKI
jgi:hypothetical protein